MRTSYSSNNVSPRKKRRRAKRTSAIYTLTIALLFLFGSLSISSTTFMVHASSSSSSSNPTKDLYKRLGITNPKCTTKEIQKAYRKKALKHHPDKVPEDQRTKAEKEFKRIGEAYEILSNPEKRKLYDTYGEVALQPHFQTPMEQQQQQQQGRRPGGGTTATFPFRTSSSSSSQTFFFQEENPFFDSSSSRKSSSSSFQRNNNEFSPFDNLQDFILQSLYGHSLPTKSWTYGRRSSPSSQSSSPFESFTSSSTMKQSSSSSSSSSSSYERYFYCSYEDLCNPKGCKKKLKITLPPAPTDPWTSTRSSSTNQHTISTIYTIDVKPGWKQGTKVTFPPNHIQGIPSITFILKEKQHEHFTRQKNDLIYRVFITEYQAQQGNFHFYIPLLPDEMLTTSSPSRSSGSSTKKKQTQIYISKTDKRLPITNQSVYKLVGRGMYYKGGMKRGDLIVRFHVIPSTSSSSSTQTTADQTTSTVRK